MVEICHKAIKRAEEIIRVSQIEVQIELFLDPTVKSFNDRIVCWRSGARHRPGYDIIGMSHLIGSRGVDGALVGVQNYRRCLLILFTGFLLEDVKAMVVGSGIPISGKAMREYFIIKGIEEQCPFLKHSLVSNAGHIGHNQRKRMLRFPFALHKVGKMNVLLPSLAVPIVSCFRTDTGHFAAFVRKIVAEKPSGFMSYIRSKMMISPGFVVLAFLLQ